MFISSAQADVIIALQFLAGALIGFLIAFVTFRSRLTRPIALTTSLVTGVVLELAIGMEAWASFDQHPGWLALQITAHSFPFIASVTLGAALITGLAFNPKRQITPDQKGNT